MLISWLFLFGFWLLLIGKTSRAEIAAGAVCALAGAIAARIAAIRTSLNFRPRIRWLAEAWRIPGYVIAGTWALLKALAQKLFTRQGPRSEMRELRYEALGKSPEDAALRTLVTAFVTSTPNSIVLGVERRKGMLLLHQILPGPVQTMERNLGVRP